MGVLETVGRGLADGAGMFWQTLWALVLGFGLSGAVQAFVSRSGSTTYHFCSDHCQHRFTADPIRYTGPEQASSTQHVPATAGHSPGAGAVDPVCGMTVDPATATAHASHDGKEYYFCGPGCRDHSTAGPASSASEHAHHQRHPPATSYRLPAGDMGARRAVGDGDQR